MESELIMPAVHLYGIHLENIQIAIRPEKLHIFTSVLCEWDQTMNVIGLFSLRPFSLIAEIGDSGKEERRL